MPCDSRSIINVQYKAEHMNKLLEAARKLGMQAHVQRDGSVAIDSRQGSIIVRAGSLECDNAARADASALMRGYAKEVFDSWAESYPDRYETVSESKDQVVLNIKGRR